MRMRIAGLFSKATLGNSEPSPEKAIVRDVIESVAIVNSAVSPAATETKSTDEVIRHPTNIDLTDAQSASADILIDKLVSPKEFMDVHFNNLEEFVVIRRRKNKTKKNIMIPTIPFDLAKPAAFLQQLAQSRTAIVAKSLKTIRHMAADLQNELLKQPDNLDLYACAALLSDDIKLLDRDKLFQTVNYVIAKGESHHKIMQTLGTMYELLYGENKRAEFAELLKSRNDDDFYINVSGVDFSGIEFYRVNLNYADMRNCKFENSTILACQLRHADLQAASFTKVTISDSDLDEANFCKSKHNLIILNGNTYVRTSFINPDIKLTKETINKFMSKLHQLRLPPDVILANINRNLANLGLQYSVDEQFELLTEMGNHDCFNTGNMRKPDSLFLAEIDYGQLIKIKCRESIQQQWENLAKKISRRLNTGM